MSSISGVLSQRILFIRINRLCIAKGCVLNGCVPRKIHLKNTLKVYVLGLVSVVIPKNLLTIRLVLQRKPEQLFKRHTKTGTSAPLIVTYHPRFHNSSNITRKLFIYLYVEEQVTKVFTPAPFVSFRSSYSLRSHLVRAKVLPLIRGKRSSCCGKSSCEICFNIQETDTFQSFVTKEVYKINHHFHCDSKYVIYPISCKVCGLQYVGSTVDRFHLRTIMDYLRIVR